MSFRVVDPARLEFAHAAFGYDQRQVGLGDQFVDAVKNAFQRIANDPSSLPKETTARWRRNIRRCPVDGFPYDVIFEIRPEELKVLAVAQGNRQPGYWKRRK